MISHFFTDNHHMEPHHGEGNPSIPVLVRGQIHSMEVAQHIAVLHIFGNQTELAERTLWVNIFLQIGKRYLENATLQIIRSNTLSLCAIHEGFADLTGLEHVRCLDIVPILAWEGIYHLLLTAFLTTFGETLIFTDRHGKRLNRKRSRHVDENCQKRMTVNSVGKPVRNEERLVHTIRFPLTFELKWHITYRNIIYPKYKYLI